MCVRLGTGLGGHYYWPRFSLSANLCACLRHQRGGSEGFRLGRDLRDQLCQLFQHAVRKGRPERGATGPKSLLIGDKGEPRAQALRRPVLPPPLLPGLTDALPSSLSSPSQEAVRAGGSFF